VHPSFNYSSLTHSGQLKDKKNTSELIRLRGVQQNQANNLMMLFLRRILVHFFDFILITVVNHFATQFLRRGQLSAIHRKCLR